MYLALWIISLITLAVCLRYITMIIKMAMSVFTVQRAVASKTQGPLPTHVLGVEFVRRGPRHG